MSTPGFPAGTLDDEGFPAWITALESDDPNHTVHVVRGLAPADALHLLGAQPDTIVSCQLPAQRPGGRDSLPRAVIGSTDSDAVLLAGQFGSWTFVYDDSGLSGWEQDGELAPSAKMLSADGREAATSTWTINADTMLDYAVDGDLQLSVAEDLDPAEDDIPAGLRGAVEAAGTFSDGDGEDRAEPDIDCGINMRVVCALAGLHVLLDDLRQIPLLAAEVNGLL